MGYGDVFPSQSVTVCFESGRERQTTDTEWDVTNWRHVSLGVILGCDVRQAIAIV